MHIIIFEYKAMYSFKFFIIIYIISILLLKHANWDVKIVVFDYDDDDHLYCVYLKFFFNYERNYKIKSNRYNILYLIEGNKKSM